MPIQQARMDAPIAQRLIALGGDVVVDLARRELWLATPPIFSSRQDETGSSMAPGTDIAESEGKKVSLTRSEGKLLKVLLENRGRVLTHRELVLLAQGYEVTDFEAPEVLRPLVSRLRQKLKRFPAGETWIVNVRGTGYVLERRLKDIGPADGIERRRLNPKMAR
jgi:DNA-binding response OmpR family regulator